MPCNIKRTIIIINSFPIALLVSESSRSADVVQLVQMNTIKLNNNTKIMLIPFHP